jgi:hypothetical protein
MYINICIYTYKHHDVGISGTANAKYRVTYIHILMLTKQLHTTSFENQEHWRI